MRIKRHGYYRNKGVTELVKNEESLRGRELRISPSGEIVISMSHICGDGESYYNYAVSLGRGELRDIICRAITEANGESFGTRMICAQIREALPDIKAESPKPVQRG